MQMHWSSSARQRPGTRAGASAATNTSLPPAPGPPTHYDASTAHPSPISTRHTPSAAGAVPPAGRRQSNVASSDNVSTPVVNPAMRAPLPGVSSPGSTAHREAPAISGATTAAAAAGETSGILYSGTRTHFTDTNLAAAYGPNGSSSSTVLMGPSGVCDADEAQICLLLRELEGSVDSPNAFAVMQDAATAIEARALASVDPLSRDYFLEQVIRDVLTELSRNGQPSALTLAANFIEVLLPIAYTSPQPKFTRLVRSLLQVLQCGVEGPARAAQRVYRKLLTMDAQYPSAEAPLRHFIPKELKDSCESALLQLHGRVQQSPAPFQEQYFSIMLFDAVTAEVSPRYLTSPVRRQVTQLATILAGSNDVLLRDTAYNCLVAIFKNTSMLRRNEAVIEYRRVCDEALRVLSTSQANESQVLSTLKTLRALVSTRGLANVDKQLMAQLCVLVTEQHRINKSSLIRAAVCDLVPIIAPIDISLAARWTSYCAIIMEPVKNVRDERSKAQELLNVAAFIESVGYGVLDSTNQTNLDSILLRYISWEKTQEACWAVIAAIVTSCGADGTPRRRSRDASRLQESTDGSTSAMQATVSKPATPKQAAQSPLGPRQKSSSVDLDGAAQARGRGNPASNSLNLDDLILRCLFHISNAVLTRGLVKHLERIQSCIPQLHAKIQKELDELVDITLHKPSAEAGASARVAGGTAASDKFMSALPSSAGGLSSNFSSPHGVRYAASSAQPLAGRLPQYFRQADSAHDTAHPRSSALVRTSDARPVAEAVPNARSGSTQASPLTTLSAHTEAVADYSDLTVALELFARRHVTSVQQLEEIRKFILPLQLHQDSRVREQCSLTIVASLSDWVEYAKTQNTSSYSTRVTGILEVYVKNTLMEMDPACRLREVTLLTAAKNLLTFFSEQRILSALLSFLNDTAAVREKTVKLLVSITQDPKPSASVVAVQQSLDVIVESCVVALEYTTELRTLIRSMADLQMLINLRVKTFSGHLSRIFYAFRRRLLEDNVPDVILLSTLKTLETILTALARDDSSALSQYQDDVVELYQSIVGILKQSSSSSVSHAVINVLVRMNNMCAYPPNFGVQKQLELMNVVANVYTGSNCTQRERFNMLTLFGQVGAVDPTVKLVPEVTKKRKEAAIQDEADLELTYDYNVIVYRTLSRMLDVTLSETVCIQALRTLLQFIRFTQEKKELVGGVHAVRAVLQVAKRSSDNPVVRNEAVHVLAAIAVLRHDRVAKVLLPEIVVLLEQLWIPSDQALFRNVLEVVSALKLGKLSGKEQSESWAWLYPRLVDVALQDHTETREFCLRVVEIILSASYIPPHCIPLVFPMFMQFIQQTDQPVEVRGQSLCAAVHIVCELKAVQYFATLLHGIRTLTRHCAVNEDLGARLSTPGVRESLKVLVALHPSGRPTIKALRDCLNDNADRGTTARGIGVRSSHSGGTVSAPDAGSSVVSGGIGIGSSSSAYFRPSKSAAYEEDDDEGTGTLRMSLNAISLKEDNTQEVSLFMKHIDSGPRTKETKLREWFSELQKCIILVSPHPAFRMMVDLFDKSEPLRRELFHPSFKSLYEVLTAEQIKRVNDVLTYMLNSNDNEVVSKCLGLADYLDHNQPNIQAAVLDELRTLEKGDSTVSSTPNASGASPLRAATENTFTVGTQRGTDASIPLQAQPVDPSQDKKANAVSSSPSDYYDATTCNPSEDLNHTQAMKMVEGHSTATSVNDSGDDTSMRSNLRPVRPSLDSTKSEGEEEDDGGVATTSSHVAASGAESPTGFSNNDASSVALGTHIPFKPNVLFSTENIVNAAERTRMYDKAFSYLENRLSVVLHTYGDQKVPQEFVRKIVWPLAWLYSKREMQDSVVGLFHTIRYKSENSDGFSFELLRWWDEAQRVYAKAVGLGRINLSASPLVLEGYVRTLCFCGEWSAALDAAKRICYESSAATSTVAQCGAMSAWLLGKWSHVSRMAEHISVTERSSIALKLFYINGCNLHAVMKKKDEAAYGILRRAITQSKLAVDENLRTLMPLSYSHAYENLTMLQHFTEMEEIIEYKHSDMMRLNNNMKTLMRQRWHTRFTSLKPNSLHPCLRSLMLHSLVLSTGDMSDTILHFCETMSPHYPQLTQWAMNWLRDGVLQGRGGLSPGSSPTSTGPDTPHVQPTVTIGLISNVWTQGRRGEAVASMEQFLTERGAELEERNAECYGNAQLRLGMWKQELHSDCFWKRGFREEELGHFHKAIRAVPSSYEAWHSWGLLNYRVQQRNHSLTVEERRSFVEAAHQGFVAAISRCKDSSEAMPGIMRLLQLWVLYNGVELLKETVADSISRITLDHWVQTIPQLIGQLSSDNHDIREVIGMILRALCKVHPQAVVFPLLVVILSEDTDNFDTPQLRKVELVRSIIQHCPQRICSEAQTVAKLLVDVAAIPIEKIRESLTRVAAAWNPNAEFEEDEEDVFKLLNVAVHLFNENRKHLLYTVGDIGTFLEMVMKDYRRGRREKAAGIVNQLVDEISRHVAEKLGKEPQKAMEPLLRLRNLSIAVFGEYDIGMHDYPTIASFSSKLDVIPSKKRPRRIQLNGSDGCVYSYCLKGNEDIRMDERVMQLFGMANVLLTHSRASNGAYIHRFPVIPISSNVGLLGWVENANTINNTICNYRNSISHLRTHQESAVLRAYVESVGQWNKLGVVQRAEVLDHVMHSEHCEAVDVSRAMWHRSNTAEQWLDRRINFTTSLATMSMVGYVLGLGDRHLGNILLSMSTGSIVHIDFGDSFDVGRLRHVLPETVPFRLTRMLTNAMEVFGVDGVFRASATRTQTTLRQERDSIMALLSAFVYDPIVQHKGKMKNILEKSRSPQNVVERIRNKLRGAELAVPTQSIKVLNTTRESCRRPDLLYMSKAFDDDAVRDQRLVLNTAKQVDFLIEEATRVDNYAALYFGWGPLW